MNTIVKIEDILQEKRNEIEKKLEVLSSEIENCASSDVLIKKQEALIELSKFNLLNEISIPFGIDLKPIKNLKYI